MRRVHLTFPRDCLDVDADQRAECSGPARYRMTLSTRGPRLPLCDLHWDHRLQQLDKSDEVHPPRCPPGVWILVAPAQVGRCIVEDVVNWPARQTMGS